VTARSGTSKAAGGRGPASTVDPSVAAIEASMTELFRLAGSRRVHASRQARSGTSLSRTEWELLRRVDDLGPIRVHHLAELVDLSPAVTSRALAALEAREMVLRAPTPGDARGVSFRASAKGRRTRARFQAAMDAELDVVLRRWPADQRAALADLFTRLVDDLRGAGATAG
jgi:DNA-binding MarR family transcriptional regulator